MRHVRQNALRAAGLIAGALTLSLASGSLAHAHHSSQMFDMTSEVRLEGVIKAFKWTNPHSWIEIDIPDGEGKTVMWGVEMTSPSILANSGWKRSTLKTGDTVVLYVAPLRDGKPGGSFIGVKLGDGTWLGRGEPRE